MAAMTTGLLLLAAAATFASPDSPTTAATYTGARAEGRVSVTIVAGARIAAGESQETSLPALRHSSIRAADGSVSPARLVEFE